MSELLCLELSVVLWVVHVLVQAGASTSGASAAAGCSAPRDKPAAAARARSAAARPGRSPTTSRTSRAFVALDLALIATHHTGGWGATIWIVARIVYLPLYLFGVIYVRSALGRFARRHR